MISCSSISEMGNREVNEDSVGIFRNDKVICAVLADGLGGHMCGDVASSMAVENVLEMFREKPEVSFENISMCFERVQENLLKKQSTDFKLRDLKTTLVILMADEKHLIWGHVGDSRIYYFNRKKLIEHTLDHSVPQALVAAGQIKERKIRKHPDRNKLLRVMGAEWRKPAYAISSIHDSKSEMAFLMCSDGFWEWVNERQMEVSLRKSKNAEEWLERMQNIVEKKGRTQDMDNYSAITVQI